MRKKHESSEPRAWVPLGDSVPAFDQTNGVVDLSEAESSEAAPHEYDESDMLARGAASNAASIGWSGGF
jgi:hypothetical protein